MGISDIFGKKNKTEEHTVEEVTKPEPKEVSIEPVSQEEDTFKPENMPTRGANGKFVSKKSSEEPVEDKPIIEEQVDEEQLGSEPIVEENTHEEVSREETTPDIQETGIVNEAEPSQQNNTPNPSQISTFYGQEVRKFYEDSVWYFCLSDILSVAKIVDIAKFVSELKNDPATKKVYDQNVKIISSEENEKDIDLDCISYEGFMSILPILRNKEILFPGPFPEWLQNMSSVDA